MNFNQLQMLNQINLQDFLMVLVAWAGMDFFNKPEAPVQKSPMDMMFEAYEDLAELKIEQDGTITIDKVHQVSAECEMLHANMLVAAQETGDPALVQKIQDLWEDQDPARFAGYVGTLDDTTHNDYMRFYARADNFRDGIRTLIEENPALKDRIESDDFDFKAETQDALSFDTDEIIADQFNRLQDIRHEAHNQVAPDRMDWTNPPRHMDPLKIN